MADTYTHGHQDCVLRSHRWRTAENSAAYLLATLTKGDRLLDVGCGPGTITLDLARRVSPGAVLGIDVAQAVVDEAEVARRQSGVDNASFAVGDVYALDHQDASFDVVHAHQVLQHLSDPVRALVEMRRVLRPGGVLAVRDTDYGAFAWAPADPRLDRWLVLHHQVTAANHAEADAGRHLLSWVNRAGFSHSVATSSTWTFAEPETRGWWAGLWAERVGLSAFAAQALSYGLTDQGELAAISQAWREWALQPDAVFIVVHGEVLARR
ncbi:MAG: methyltransferase domain-containing protein [Actinomycetota bacterium]